MAILDFFRKRSDSAQLAKDRLQIVVARERGTSGAHAPSYLPQLQQELLAVLAKFEKIDLTNVTVKVDRSGDYDVLELNIILPEDTGEGPSPGPGAKKAATLTA